MPGIGCYPGSFNPLTVAHLAIAEAAREACDLERLDLVVSRIALDKEGVDRPRLLDRLAVLRAAAATRPWLDVLDTESQLLADIARGYDVLVVGSDKWAQINDARFYGNSAVARDAALATLPALAIAPRRGHEVPVPPGTVSLELAGDLAAVSSTVARAGDRRWMAPEALEFDGRTGAWSDAERYDRWLAGEPAVD